MKNILSILTLLAFSVFQVSALALPVVKDVAPSAGVDNGTCKGIISL